MSFNIHSTSLNKVKCTQSREREEVSVSTAFIDYI